MDDGFNVIESNESIFEVEADMLVNPVNCKGVSGKGLALEFKHKFPICQAKYEEICRREIFINDPTGVRRKVAAFRPGDVLHFIDINKDRITKEISQMEPQEIEDLLNRRQHIVFLPTKNHWKNPSTYEYVRGGLKSLGNLLKKEGLESVKTIAIPALGCGLGSLDWEKVKSIIIEELKESGKTLILFPPR
jgi:O-acetyl-ADP-ribose deacetylase (regulator of RNase III)